VTPKPRRGAKAALRLEAFLATWNTHDLDRIVALFASDGTIEDEFVIIDPDRPPGSRSYTGREEIRAFAALATPGFRVELLDAVIEDVGSGVRFTARVGADGLRRRGIESIEQRDELEFDPDGLVRTFRIGYPPASQVILREAAKARRR